MEAKSDSAEKAPDQERASEIPGWTIGFYVPTWERTPFPREVAPDIRSEDAYW
jgi:hypothetical protein